MLRRRDITQTKCGISQRDILFETLFTMPNLCEPLYIYCSWHKRVNKTWTQIQIISRVFWWLAKYWLCSVTLLIDLQEKGQESSNHNIISVKLKKFLVIFFEFVLGYEIHFKTNHLLKKIFDFQFTRHFQQKWNPWGSLK